MNRSSQKYKDEHLVQQVAESHRRETPRGQKDLLPKFFLYFKYCMKFILVLLFILIICFRLNAQDNLNVGEEYYLNINKAEIHYYEFKNFDSAVYYYKKAFLINKPFAGNLWGLSLIFMKKGYDKEAYNYLQKAIINGFEIDKFSISIIKESNFFHTYYGQKILNTKDSLYGVFKQKLNIKQTNFINYLMGGDQIIRQIDQVKDFRPYDSLNYEELLSHIEENGFPDFHYLDFESIKHLDWMYHHFANYPDKQNGFKLLQLRNEAFKKGLIHNTTFIDGLDYLSMMETEKQLYGNYTKKTKTGSYEYEAFRYTNIDSVRFQYHLPPLKLSQYFNKNLKLPETYEFKNYYTD